MAAKYYAIKKGEDSKTKEAVNNIIVRSWNECLSYVKGVKGAIYKSFASESEAMEYINSESSLKKDEDQYPEDIPHIYVDGSYNISTDRFGYGLVVILNDEVIYAAYGGGQDKECNQRQVNGELRAAVEGVKYSIDQNYNHVVIFYDYAGVCNHATGAWARSTDLSKEYYEIMRGFMEESNIKITFVKVDSHTDDLFNDIADELAKTGAELEYSSAVDKALNTTTIKTSSSEVREVLCSIINRNKHKIMCDNETYAAIDAVGEELEAENKNESVDEVQNIIEHIKSLSEAQKLRYIKSLKKDIQTQIILRLL